MGLLRGRLFNFGMVLVVRFVLLVSLLLSAAIVGLNDRIENFPALPVFVFTQVYAKAGGRTIKPAANAEQVFSGDRAQQGLVSGLPPTTDPSDATAESPAPPSFLRRTIAPLLKYIEACGISVTIKAREALKHLISMGIELAVAIVPIFAGWLLLVTAPPPKKIGFQILGALAGSLHPALIKVGYWCGAAKPIKEIA